MADTKHASHPNSELIAEGRRPCPICGSMMAAEEHDNISIDLCAKHGVWLDLGELEKIVSKAKGISRRKGLRAARDAKVRGRYEGVVFGWLSLLWD